MNDLALGNCTVNAYAWHVPGEINNADNNFAGGFVTVTIPGDIDGDVNVNLGDLVLLSNTYGTSPNQPVNGSCVWSPDADINNSGKVHLGNLVIMSNNYRPNYP